MTERRREAISKNSKLTITYGLAGMGIWAIFQAGIIFSEMGQEFARQSERLTKLTERVDAMAVRMAAVDASDRWTGEHMEVYSEELEVMNMGAGIRTPNARKIQRAVQ